ncbi:tetratricopeptide repeat protein [Marinobacter oulmenensis]|uniref:Tetratricopeptide (TPR) repeat protein n=1 Tax=Marinobacter oulmenensis TaxID=643747 RepID=A0A840UA59_9GAMM|nr:tetratricopeptide repeat protein [Marinobacter oulmenensis]MBB5320060.1 tetratricopeptide (TPR) repeat protein [Marinobacter oulmenensis]
MPHNRLFPNGYLTLLITLLFVASAVSAATDEWQTLQSQATAAYQAAEYEQARKAVNKAIARAQKADNGAAYQASSLNLLAFIESAQGDSQAAIEAMDQALALAGQTYPDPHGTLASLRLNRGLLLHRAGQAKEADAALGQVIDDYLQLNDTGNGNLWKAVLTRAQILADQSPGEAVALLSQATRGLTSASGKTLQPDANNAVALTLLLGRVQYQQGQYQKALDSLNAARSSNTSTGDSQQQIEILELMARCHDALGQSDVSIQAHKQLLELRAGEPASMARVMHLNELAMTHQGQKQYGQAAQLYQEALEMLEQMGKTGSAEQALVLGNFGSLRLTQKRTDAALPLLKQAYALHQRPGQYPQEASASAGYLGALYYNLGRLESAEQPFLDALRWLEQAPGTNPQARLVALENLRALYTRWGKPGKARPYERKAQALRAEIREQRER